MGVAVAMLDTFHVDGVGMDVDAWVEEDDKIHGLTVVVVLVPTATMASWASTNILN